MELSPRAFVWGGVEMGGGVGVEGGAEPPHAGSDVSLWLKLLACPYATVKTVNNSKIYFAGKYLA